MRTTGRRMKLAAPAAAALLLLALNLSRPAEVRAQWTTDQNNHVTTTLDKVGVGTRSPSAKLVVQGDSSDAAAMPGIMFENSADALQRKVRVQNYYPGITYFSANTYRDPTTSSWSLDNPTRGSAGLVLNTAEWTPGIGNYLNLWAAPNGVSGATPNLILWDSGKVSVNRPVSLATQSAAGLFDIAGKGSTSATASLAVSNSAAASLLYVRDDGNVGVGTTSPTSALEVGRNVAGAPYGLTVTGGSTVAAPILFFNYADAGANLKRWGVFGDIGGGLNVGTQPDAGGAMSTKLYVANGGNVGIGITSPTELLDVSGAGEVKARAVGTISAAVKLQETSGTATWSEWQQIGDRLRLNTNDGGTTRPDVMAILPNGVVGIGTATPGSGLTDPAVKLDVQGSINVSGNINAKYQDVAEWVPSTQKLSAGTVVVLDSARTNHVLASSSAYDTKVAGVVSEQPGVILGTGGEGKLKVATTGRVKVKVDASRGAIKVGDLLVTSGVEGVAMKSVPVDLGGTPIHRPGTIIGKALEPLESGTGEILVLLSLQ